MVDKCTLIVDHIATFLVLLITPQEMIEGLILYNFVKTVNTSRQTSIIVYTYIVYPNRFGYKINYYAGPFYNV